MLVSNSDNHKHNCQFAEESVRYLYGELDKAQKEQFSLHLNNCSSCADELKAFSSIHSSIQNWKSAKFDALSTPVIQIPAGLRQKSGAKAAVSSSWLTNLREKFPFSPGWVQAGAFAALLICLSIGLYFLNSFDQRERASEKTDNKITAEVPPFTNSEAAKIKESDSVSPNEKDFPKSENTKSAESSTNDLIDEKISATKKSAPAKVTTTRKNSEIKEKPVKQRLNRKNKEPEAYANAAPVNIRNLPKLNNLPEESEDEDLRLADLFDEIDAG